MAKLSVTFRFSEEVLSRLAELADGSGLTRTQVLERLILAARSVSKTTEEELERWAAQKSVAASSGGAKPLPAKAGRPDPDKLADFSKQHLSGRKK